MDGERLLGESSSPPPPPPPLSELFSDSRRLRAICCVAIVNCSSMIAGSCMMAPFQELLLERACGRLGLSYPSSACASSRPAQEEASARVAYYNLAMQVRGAGAAAAPADGRRCTGRSPSWCDR